MKMKLGPEKNGSFADGRTAGMQNSVLLKHRTAAWMLFLCLFGIAAALAAYQAIWPEASGKDVQKSKSLVVDAEQLLSGVYHGARRDGYEAAQAPRDAG